MAKKKLRVGVLFGGRSGEHEVSLLSANSILKAIDRKKYEVVPIGITKQGRWLGGDGAKGLLTGDSGLTLSASAQVTETGLIEQSGGVIGALDVIFPVLHGTFGEDGTIQGMLELADLAYVGSGVLGSAAGMDKDVMKKLFAAAGLPQTPYLSVLRSEWKADAKGCRKRIEKALEYPLFVKPANLGSSVGISKVHGRDELAAAMDLAAGFDRKLVVEQGVGGPGAKPRELEVAVLGNETLEASVVGEIVPAKEFYDYEAKYQMNGPDESVCIIPAKLSASEQKQMRAMAMEAFRACDCSGLARVDFLMEPAAKGKKAKFYLNEINTMPGFTSISMYPKLWGASGVGYTELIDRLIVLAQERHAEKMATAFARE
ncbi:D-alanine--D-alanine ligase family protein [Granulicella tundricola]|uniref:D-alanine--D-alanine ligase n=1 Tax=Granulicella tundricola (strain ATCC BAA-1859 / DSM 23138 / MP5ACTX9) TaxID=1198114 RepID=E8WWT4_GRATM|nr:D-alanine--D-alanine ligase family protein [Granulicella tundricola]ADW67412.1 D-alanine/D-alanine ligase [Granulicella tundricola MP5ACTX9]